MPKQTFYNLSQEKKDKITNSAIEEFSCNTFSNASITKIAQNSGISKGSMYQYFEDKKELYKYVLTLASERKMEYLSEFMANINTLHFIDLIRELYVKGIQFTHDNPKLAGIANNFVKEINSNLKNEIMGMNTGKSNEFFEHIIKNAKAKNEIDESIDTEIGAFLITSLNISLMDYVIENNREKDIFDFTNNLLESVDKMLVIIKNGFEKK